jgi:hypothetical protein
VKTRPKRTTLPLPPSKQWQNFCEAMAEQELLEAGAFPDAKDVTDVHNELERLANQITTEKDHPKNSPATASLIVLPGGSDKALTVVSKSHWFKLSKKQEDAKADQNSKKHPWDEDDTMSDYSAEGKNRWIESSDRRERPAAETPYTIDDKTKNKP